MAKTAPSDESVASEITEIVAQLKDDFGRRDALHEDIEKVIHRDIPVDIPKAYQRTALEVHTPLPAHIANTVTAALSVNPPTVSFPPVGMGDSGEANATLREHFFEASWRRQEEEAKQRLFRKFMYSLVTKGEAVLKTVERTKKAWAGYDQMSKDTLKMLDGYPNIPQGEKDRLYNRSTEEFKRQAPYPIATVNVIPSTFYYLKGEDGFTFASEVKTVPYYDALERYGYALDSTGKVVPQATGMPRPEWKQVMGKARSLKMIEAWDWQYVTYILVGPGQESSTAKVGKGTIVKRIKHGYGDPYLKVLRGPYFHAQGLTTDSVEHDRAAMGVLTPFLELFPLLDSLYTIRANAAYMAGYPAYKRKAPEGAAMPPAAYGQDGSDDDDEEAGISPGDVLPYDVEPIEQPKTSFDFNQMIADVKGMVEIALPSIVQGVVDGGESGYALNQAAHLARLTWDPMVDNAEFALAERTSFESWLIENRVKESVYVWGQVPPAKRQKGRDGWLTVGPDDLSGVHRYSIRLDPSTPSNKVIEIRSHEEMLAQRLETRPDAINALGGNPDEVEYGWLLEDLKQDQVIIGKLKQRVFQKLAVIDQADQAAAQGNQDGGMQAPQPQPTAGGPGVGQVYQPGQNGVPMTPTPQGSVTGMGPGGGASAPQGMGGPPGLPAGMTPTPPSLPANHIPLPGQS